MSFKKNKYTIVRNAISKELANFIMNYFLLQENAVIYLLKSNEISKNNKLIGNWNDHQSVGAYSKYADWNTETLLMYVKPKIEKLIKTNLIPTYSYARIYKKGNELKNHIDRKSCELSTTLFLGGSKWDIFLKNKENKTIKVSLSQGDMLIYSGCELEHWREKLQGEFCVQTFLHYNYESSDNKNLFDQRPTLGVPKL